MAQYHFLRDDVIKMLEKGTLLTEGPGEPTRFSYAEGIIETGRKHPEVVVLDADVSKGVRTCDFACEFPDREYNFGISEQNMVAAAAGMATYGLVPFVTTYAIFVALRALDQVRNSICYTNLNVKIAASHSGITASPDGVTHQGQEDLTIMRAMPNMTVIAPADPVSTKMATEAMASFTGPAYLSLTRWAVPVLYRDDYPMELGKAVTIRDGADATIIANRDMVVQSLVAAQELAGEGLDVRVIDCHTLKPLDTETILSAASETGAIVTAEDNVINGGLGSAVAEVLVENDPVPMQRIGVRDTFAESGPYPELIDKYGLSARHIAQAVRQVITRKN